MKYYYVDVSTFSHLGEGILFYTKRIVKLRKKNMAFNVKMADRVREMIAAVEANVEEKKMFSGLCFMVNDKMCVAVRESSIMVRLDPVMFEDIVGKEGVGPMVHNGKEMKGYFFVDEEVLKTKKQLAYWVDLALEFNKFAKASKKKK